MIPIANHYGALAPLISVAAGALALILVDALTSVISRGTPLKFSGARLGAVLAVGATVILVHTLFEVGALLPISATEVADPAQSMLLVDVSASIGMGLLAAAGLVTVWLALGHLPALHIDHGEFYPLVLLSLAGALASICAIDLASLFLGLELMSLPLHALAGSDGRRPRSNEAGLKSFLTGAFASAIILYGIALLYGAAGTTNITEMVATFQSGVDLDNPNALALAGVAL
jgi:NADH-quinone oxidoreductase subunit N